MSLLVLGILGALLTLPSDFYIHLKRYLII